MTQHRLILGPWRTCSIRVCGFELSQILQILRFLNTAWAKCGLVGDDTTEWLPLSYRVTICRSAVLSNPLRVHATKTWTDFELDFWNVQTLQLSRLTINYIFRVIFLTSCIIGLRLSQVSQISNFNEEKCWCLKVLSEVNRKWVIVCNEGSREAVLYTSVTSQKVSGSIVP